MATSQSEAVKKLFSLVDEGMTGELNADQVQAVHDTIRMGGVSLPQVPSLLLKIFWKFKLIL